MAVTTQREVRRASKFQPSTLNEAERTCELVIATEAPIDGIVLSCRSTPNWGPAPVPVLLGHANRTDAMAGRLENLRIVNRQLIGTARFTDCPAADAGFELARSGCAVSVGASLDGGSLEPHSMAADIARNWRLREASLVPCGADVNCVTRSHNQTPLENDMTTATTNDQTTESTGEVQRTARELKRERDIFRAVSHARLEPAFADELIESSDSVERCHHRIYEKLAAGLSPSTAGRMTGLPIDPQGPQGIEAAIESVIVRGERCQDPLWLQLRAAGWGRGRNAVDVVTRALSTSDLPALLTSAGERRLMEQFSMAQGGIMRCATIRPLSDYRNAQTLDAGAIGSARKLSEGGEIPFTSVSETSVTYRAYRWAQGLKMTAEAMANDDLGGLAQALSELGAACLDAEKTELVALLTASSNLGAVTGDGKALFHADHLNTATGGVGITGLGAAVSKMREQRSLGGRYIDVVPSFILCAPSLELTVKQVLSDTLTAATPENVNPFRSLDVEIEPRLGASFVYIVADAPRRPLELGRLTDAPQLNDEREFSTSSYRAKAEHSFGCCVSEYRSIIRLAI